MRGTGAEDGAQHIKGRKTSLKLAADFRRWRQINGNVRRLRHNQPRDREQQVHRDPVHRHNGTGPAESIPEYRAPAESSDAASALECRAVRHAHALRATGLSAARHAKHALAAIPRHMRCTTHEPRRVDPARAAAMDQDAGPKRRSLMASRMPLGRGSTIQEGHVRGA